MIGQRVNVLDKGFVQLVDVMGDDAAVVQAARTSYGKGTKTVHEDRGLIRYLMRHRHSTPMEMANLKFFIRCPMDCWRQWIRHRTACLTGDTEVIFQRPCDGRAYPMKIEDIYDKFQPTSAKVRADKQGNPYHKKEIVQNMYVRSVDELTGEVITTHIVDIWFSGTKEVFEVKTESGRKIKASKDHLFLTSDGWKKLEELQAGTELIAVGSVSRKTQLIKNNIDPDKEEWLPLPDWEDYYLISNQGRVKRIVGGKGSRSFGRCKKITISNGRAVVSLNRPGVQEAIQIQRSMARAFLGEPEKHQEVRHLDGNALNNNINNLKWGTAQENSQDRIEHGATTKLGSFNDSIASIKSVGEDMTFDIEVEGPWHNFCANGLIVHNSVNEYSTRYSEAIDDKQETAPNEWRSQSKSNKQGSGSKISHEDGLYLTLKESEFHERANELYQDRLKRGVAREQARKDLPLSTYTEAYWSINLHNLFHFLGLRMDGHAQLEIRSYAKVIGEEFVSKLFPHCWEAFVDYRLNSLTFTGVDLAVLTGDFDKASKRELKELALKLEKINLNVPYPGEWWHQLNRRISE